MYQHSLQLTNGGGGPGPAAASKGAKPGDGPGEVDEEEGLEEYHAYAGGVRFVFDDAALEASAAKKQADLAMVRQLFNDVTALATAGNEEARLMATSLRLADLARARQLLSDLKALADAGNDDAKLKLAAPKARNAARNARRRASLNALKALATAGNEEAMRKLAARKAARNASLNALKALAAAGNEEAMRKLAARKAAHNARMRKRRNARLDMFVQRAMDSGVEPAEEAKVNFELIKENRVDKDVLAAKNQLFLDGGSPMVVFKSIHGKSTPEKLDRTKTYTELVDEMRTISRVKVCACTQGIKNLAGMRDECITHNGGDKINYQEGSVRNTCTIHVVATLNAVDAAGTKGDVDGCVEKVVQDALRNIAGEKCEYGAAFRCGAGMGGFTMEDKAEMKKWETDHAITYTSAKLMLRLRQMAHRPMTVCIVTWRSMGEDDITVRKQLLDDSEEEEEDDDDFDDELNLDLDDDLDDDLEEEEEEEEDDDDDEARALESRQRAFAKGLQPPCFAFIHLGGSEEMLKQKYPVGLAYLTDLEEKNSSPNDHNDDAPWLFATVAWYVRHGWTTKNFPVSRKAAYTKLIVTDGSKASKKRKVSAGAAPPAETWFKETNFGISNCVVPIAVPIDLSNGPRQTVALSIDFMKKLAQVCEDYGFVAHP